MKEFINTKTTLLKRDDAGIEIGNVHFAELAAITLNVTPKEGWTTDEMRKRLPLHEKFEKLKPNAKLLLENSEVQTLVDCVKISWKMAHAAIIEYEDYIFELQKSKDVKVTSTKK